jgi:hypothetical protein
LPSPSSSSPHLNRHAIENQQEPRFEFIDSRISRKFLSRALVDKFQSQQSTGSIEMEMRACEIAEAIPEIGFLTCVCGNKSLNLRED